MQIHVQTPLPDDPQPWGMDDERDVLQTFKATEVSYSWKDFLVPPEPQPGPLTSAETALEVAFPAEDGTKAEDSVAVEEEAPYSMKEDVCVETVVGDVTSEVKAYDEATEEEPATESVLTMWAESSVVVVVEEVTPAFTEVSSEDAIPADKTIASEPTVVQEVEEAASVICEIPAEEALVDSMTPVTALAALHESFEPGENCVTILHC